MNIFSKVATIAIALLLSGGIWSASRTWREPKAAPSAPDSLTHDSIRAAADRVDALFEQHWQKAGIEPLLKADRLTLARRLALATVGSAPSLEEIRWIESQGSPSSQGSPNDDDSWMQPYLERRLADRRFSEFTAERLTEAWMPFDVGDNFFLYRKGRFLDWLTDQIHEGRPYAAVIREIIASEGLWTDRPSVNFLTSYYSNPEMVASQTTRAFLGLRLECAQCHNHPFAPWKQEQFRGLAAYFGTTRLSFRGVVNDGPMHRFGRSEKDLGDIILPSLPYGSEAPCEGSELREHLAAWITSPENSRFRQTIASRVWQMMFGMGLVDPVDDLDAPPSVPGVLEALAEDFEQSDGDIRRLFRVVAATRVFQIRSEMDSPATAQAKDQWAAFPAVRLSPAQVARSLTQVTSLETIDRDSAVAARLSAFFDRHDFISAYRTNSDDINGTMAQRLMLMNDPLVSGRVEPTPFSSVTRVALMAPDDQSAIETLVLVVLARRPSSEEQSGLVELVEAAGHTKREDVFSDIAWALVNSTDFQWNR